ncbi:MAG TPA: hypothetical protein VI341_09420 [Actinomycetota bacterium]
MIDSKRLRSLWLVAAVSMVGVLAMGTTASAHRGGSGAKHVVVRGACSEASHWRVHLVQHRHVIGVGFEVKSGVPGEIWRVKIEHGERLVFLDLRRTSNPEGVLSVRRPIRNTHGLDFVRARAVNIETGEVCVGRAAI